MDGYKLVAVAIVFATIVLAWMFRFEPTGQDNLFHRNRFTGAVCHSTQECWFTWTYVSDVTITIPDAPKK